MYDFLTFNTFITQKVLLLFYYIGAIGFPLLILTQRKKFLKKFLVVANIELWVKNLYSSLKRRDRIIAIVTIFFLFFCMELFWRMMFEMMIGYFDMHDYLQQLSEQAH